MKYPTVRVTGIHGEFEAYEAKVNGETLFVDQILADNALEGSEAYIDAKVKEFLSHGH